VFLGFRGLNRVLGLRGFSEKERYTGRQREREPKAVFGWLLACFQGFEVCKRVCLDADALCN
jgi:hypothetical protein